MITHAYFVEADFSQVELLKDTFRNLNSSLKESSEVTTDTEIFMGKKLCSVFVVI